VIGRREELHACIRVPIPAQNAFAFGEHRLTTPAARTVFLSEEEAATRLADLLAKGIRIYNRPLYRLHDLAVTSTSWTAVFSLDDYIPWRLSAGLLQDELFQGLIKADFDVENAVARLEHYHPMRSRHLGRSCASFLQPNQRFAAGGAAVACAFYRQDHDDYVIPVKRRVLEMGSGAGMLGLVPQGFHQHSVSAADEVPLALTVFRELYEELFEGEDAENNVTRLVCDWFLDPSIPPMAWFNSATKYQLYFTGYGSDSTAGTYDCAFLLAVDDPDYWSEFRRTMKFNWEFAGRLDNADSPLVSTRDTAELRRLLVHPGWTPSSLYSFIRGLVTLSQIAPSHVALPEIVEHGF
jgi:hypothetical protein